MATVHTFQAMSAPEGGTSNAAPEGVIPPAIRHQPGVVSVNGEGPAVTMATSRTSHRHTS